MLKTDRFQAIILLLEVNGTVRVSDIMEKFSVSDMTVRRDLDKMEKQGLLERQQAVQGNSILLDRMTDSIDDILTLSNNSEDISTEVVDVSLICAEFVIPTKRILI